VSYLANTNTIDRSDMKTINRIDPFSCQELATMEQQHHPTSNDSISGTSLLDLPSMPPLPMVHGYDDVHDDDHDDSETLTELTVGGILQEGEGEGMMNVDASNSVVILNSLYGRIPTKSGDGMDDGRGHSEGM
jgi:hypothetical protein